MIRCCTLSLVLALLTSCQLDRDGVSLGDTPADPDAMSTPDARPIGQVLSGLRVELPCGDIEFVNVCQAGMQTVTQQFDGEPGVTYAVTLQVRGVLEQNNYTAGQSEDMWYIGGRPNSNDWNVFSIAISDPEQTYYLNSGSTGQFHCWLAEHIKTIPITGGATVTLVGDARDNRQIINRTAMGEPIIIDDIPPAPEPYNGQFFQLDVISAEPM